jgi:hypothetical protein
VDHCALNWAFCSPSYGSLCLLSGTWCSSLRPQAPPPVTLVISMLHGVARSDNSTPAAPAGAALHFIRHVSRCCTVQRRLRGPNRTRRHRMPPGGDHRLRRSNPPCHQIALWTTSTTTLPLRTVSAWDIHNLTPRDVPTAARRFLMAVNDSAAAPVWAAGSGSQTTPDTPMTRPVQGFSMIYADCGPRVAQGS